MICIVFPFVVHCAEFSGEVENLSLFDGSSRGVERKMCKLFQRTASVRRAITSERWWIPGAARRFFDSTQPPDIRRPCAERFFRDNSIERERCRTIESRKWPPLHRGPV